MNQTLETQARVTCPRCGETNPTLARFCQQCGYRLLGPAGAKGAPSNPDGAPNQGSGDGQAPANGQGPVNGQGPAAGQGPVNGQGTAPWRQAALGGLAGFLLGSLFGGGHRGFGGWGGDDWDGGGDWGGGDGGGG